MNREPDPMEQIDYGGNYRAFQSPQQTMSLRVEGGAIAIALSLLALGGVLVASILIPTLIDKAATAASSGAVVRSQISERESRLNAEDIKLIRIALEKHGITVATE